MCPKRHARIDIGALSGSWMAHGNNSARSSSLSSSSAVSNLGTSISRASLSAASQLPPAPEDDNDDWAYEDAWWYDVGWNADGEDWFADRLLWDQWREDDAEDLCLLGPQDGRSEEMLRDSGSQSTDCREDFAPAYGTDDTKGARLWGFQDQEIKAYGNGC
jgi:hypothetical protein